MRHINQTFPTLSGRFSAIRRAVLRLSKSRHIIRLVL
jgi:hypothetical protein